MASVEQAHVVPLTDVDNFRRVWEERGSRARTEYRDQELVDRAEAIVKFLDTVADRPVMMCLFVKSYVTALYDSEAEVMLVWREEPFLGRTGS